MVELLKLASQGDEPVKVGDLVSWLHLGDPGTPEERTELESLCVAVREFAEKYCNRSFLGSVSYMERVGVQDVYRHRYPEWRTRYITLSRGPLLAVDAVKLDGAVLDPGRYSTHGGDTLLPQIGLPLWPRHGLEVTYRVGTGLDDDGNALPPPQLAAVAMKSIAGHLYANRESQEMPAGASRCLDLLRLEV